MEYVENDFVYQEDKNEIRPSQELLKKRPSDPRAWHCKTVEEYRLFKFSTDYGDASHGGEDDLFIPEEF